jgi:hypothetical protein
MMLTLLFAVSLSVAPQPVSLCLKGETPYFTCVTKSRKVLSLCGVEAGPEQSYMEYRFGSRGKKPEFVFPKVRVHPRAMFERGLMSFSGGGGHWVRFSNDNVTYTVFSALGKGWEKNGVVVEPKDKPRVFVACDSKTYRETDPTFDNIGISEAADLYSFEMP